ncbi:MAG: translocation/assembly module TamB domain-containing protein [Pseudomonadota bacterium]
MNQASTPPTDPQAAPARRRRWPKRVAIGVAVTGAILATGYWYLGRESTLQSLADQVARASGGNVAITGVKGSLYGRMQMAKVTFRSPEQLMTAEDVTIDWSPFQYLSRGIAINHLHVASLRMDALKEGEPAKMPVSLAPPFTLEINDARINKVVMANKGVSTTIADVRFDLAGNKLKWELRGASAITPWGYAKADGSIGATKPFKLDASASLTQLVPKGQPAASLAMRATGDLTTTQISASGQSGKAVGDAMFTLSPFDPVPLRAMAINGKNLNPGFFHPALPTADLTVTIAGRIGADRTIKGSANVENQGPIGTIDKQLLPLRALRGDLGGNLSALVFDGVVMDFGGAGKFTGKGTLKRAPTDAGLGVADFVLHTDRLDLKQIHSRIKTTAIAGDIRLANQGATQTVVAQLAEAGMRLDAEATLTGQLVTLQQARLVAGAGSVRVTGAAGLDGNRDFKLSASASKFNPAAFGDYPKADLNADINLAGSMVPAWKLGADFKLRPSRLFDQPLSGKGRFNADAKHVTGVAATLALGANALDLRGSFGLPGEQLTWKAEGRQLGALRADLYGAVTANGVISGSMQAPRTSFVINANGLGWVAEARKANDSALRASGEAWLAAPSVKDGPRRVEIKTSGTAQRVNPAAFGAFLPGSINASFDAAGRLGDGMQGTLDLVLKDSTLAKSPLWGHARLAADAKHISKADIDLHLGSNVVAAKGSFGAVSDVLEWRIDAPQLAALGPNFAGVLKGAGTLSGTRELPSLTSALEGQNLKLFGQHQIKSLRASATLGAGRGAADPLVSELELTDYVNLDKRVASARLQTSGTRGAHTMRMAARGEAFDASGEISGGWNGNIWSGTVASLQNKGRYAFALQAPVPVSITAPPGTGAVGLLKPQAVAVRNAVLRLPDGSINLQSLDKSGTRWSSKGSAAGVPLIYLAQFSAPIRNNLSGDLSLGGDWQVDMQAPASGGVPSLTGMVHVFREKGDLIVGAEVPVVLGLRMLDLRADISGGALRTQVQLDGTRAGQARIDATAQLVQGRITNASPLKLSANADMGSVAWLAPLSGQPGLELDGVLKLALTGGGTIGTPTLNGNISGDKLAVRWTEQGVRLRNGELRALLTGDQMQLQKLAFEGPQGRANADGFIRFAEGEASMQLKLVAEKLEILSRPDRTLVISGSSTLVRDAKRFELDGKFRADRALIELAPQDRPTLSDDVIVLGRSQPGSNGKAAPAAGMALNADIEADLGDAFRLRGMGIDAELGGTVRLRTAGGRAPRVNGTIRALNGTYKAYGQNLAIERGILTFSGPYDNPALNIRAVRRRPEGEQLTETNVEAGVEVRGTAQSPVAKLVSTPNVPDSEKLAWLVLGHGMEGVAGNEAGLLTAAAGALLGGKGGGFQSRLANSLGVDELGLSQAKGLESTVVTVGKRLSARAYLSFEQGATSASSLVKLRYKLNPKITLQFQTGANTALDVLYSWAFD